MEFFGVLKLKLWNFSLIQGFLGALEFESGNFSMHLNSFNLKHFYAEYSSLESEEVIYRFTLRYWAFGKKLRVSFKWINLKTLSSVCIPQFIRNCYQWGSFIPNFGSLSLCCISIGNNCNWSYLGRTWSTDLVCQHSHGRDKKILGFFSPFHLLWQIQ